MKNIKVPATFWFTLALLLLIAVCSYAWWLQYGTIPAKVIALQQKVDQLLAPSDTALNKTLSWQKLDLKIDRLETSLRSDFVWIQQLGIPLTLIAFVLMFWSVYKAALANALEHAQKAVEQAYLPEEERLKREKKILVLTKAGGDSAFIREFLHQTKLSGACTIPQENVKTMDANTLSVLLNGKSYDLILFNNEKIAFEDEELKACFDSTGHTTMIFSFSKNIDKKYTEMLASPRVSSANFKSQLYGNLINALKYQSYLSAPQADANT